MAQSFLSNLKVATTAQAQDILHAAVKAGTGAAAVVAPAAPSRIAPGVERWNVKVGADPDVPQITTIVDTSVRELGAIPRPEAFMPANAVHDDYNDQRAAPVETTVWRVQAQVIALRLEKDGDYHLVLQDDSGATMVVEVPYPKSDTDPPFVPATSPFFNNIQVARSAVDNQFKATLAATQFIPSIANNDAKLVPASTFRDAKGATQSINVVGLVAPDSTATFATRIDPTPATVTGVGFFDYDHGQTGNSPNILELHPVLAIDFT